MFSRRTKSFVKFIKLLSVLETVCVQCLITHAQYLRATPFSGRFRTIRTHSDGWMDSDGDGKTRCKITPRERFVFLF